jgi:hypothetical protein
LEAGIGAAAWAAGPCRIPPFAGSHFADMDGDGIADLSAGKRFYSHLAACNAGVLLSSEQISSGGQAA